LRQILRDQRSLVRGIEAGGRMGIEPVFQRRARGVLQFEKAGVILTALPPARGLHRVIEQIMRGHGCGAQMAAQIIVRRWLMPSPCHETCPSLPMRGQNAGLPCTPVA
jgi:hypothetical protein